MHTVVPIYSIPAPSFLTEMAQQYPVRGYTAGTVLIEACSVSTYFMYIEDGICQYQMGGRNLNTAAFSGKGSTIGAIPCFSPYNSHAQIGAITPVKVRTVPAEVLLEHIEEHPIDSVTFLRHVVDKTNQIWKTASLLMSLAARERFLYFINSCIAPQAAEEVKDYYPLYPVLSQTQIADMLAINRITLARVIRPLRENGLVRTAGATLRIHRDCLDALAHLRGTLFTPAHF